ncbi:CLK4-associating serine/arginine rich protein-like isoform X2 [Dreissena polymorpha]|uniref:CLK4-associating serine/arginine rich protein-like isoform X2 n=1 Tax=Dreissena polymorpha TaxID=45954 RepID=UPI002264EEDB|nr:CLK4-associating serine/arginine rich protein-like isoform X2 [Dreissena polymorpha]
MWHEARRQEKKIRGLMVDYKKRAERRREFYEKIKADPAQFVRVFGQTCKIALDPAISLAAESPQTMMPWQGDTSNMIDRFDVRAHLDIMPPEKSYTVELTKGEASDERKANYERYRILVENECAGLTEEQALHQLYIDEQFGAINKDNEEEKQKLKDKKAAIAYKYEDSTDQKAGTDSEGSESEEEDIETFDLDVVLDVNNLTEEQITQLNVCGTQFGMGNKDYIKYLRRDKDEQEALRQAKQIEEEKAQFAGRKSRRERRMYKERILAGRKLSPPSYAARDSPTYERYGRSSSSRSRSRSKSPPRHKRRKTYITSFGGNDDSEGEGVVQGPALPPGFLPTAPGSASEGTHPHTSPSCDQKEKKETLSQRLRRSLTPDGTGSPRSKDIEYSSQKANDSSSNQKKSRSRSRQRSRSHNKLSRRSIERRPRSKSNDRYRRSRSRDRSRRSRSGDRFRRSRSRDRGRWSRSRDRSRRTRSRDRVRRSRSNNRSRRSRSRDRSRRTRSRDRGRRSVSRSRDKSRRSRSRERSRRSRSRSGDWRNALTKRSKERSPKRSRSSRSHDRTKSGRSRDRSRSKRSEEKSQSRHSRSKSQAKRSRERSKGKTSPRLESKSKASRSPQPTEVRRSRTKSSSKSRSSSRSRSKSLEKEKAESPVKPVIKRYRRDPTPSSSDLEDSGEEEATTARVAAPAAQAGNGRAPGVYGNATSQSQVTEAYATRKIETQDANSSQQAVQGRQKG